jgi:hypothetical protein
MSIEDKTKHSSAQIFWNSVLQPGGVSCDELQQALRVSAETPAKHQVAVVIRGERSVVQEELDGLAEQGVLVQENGRYKIAPPGTNRY